MQFGFLSVISKYVNLAPFSKDLLTVFPLWFYCEFCWSDMNTHLVFSTFLD